MARRSTAADFRTGAGTGQTPEFGNDNSRGGRRGSVSHEPTIRGFTRANVEVDHGPQVVQQAAIQVDIGETGPSDHHLALRRRYASLSPTSLARFEDKKVAFRIRRTMATKNIGNVNVSSPPGDYPYPATYLVTNLVDYLLRLFRRHNWRKGYEIREDIEGLHCVVEFRSNNGQVIHASDIEDPEKKSLGWLVEQTVGWPERYSTRDRDLCKPWSHRDGNPIDDWVMYLAQGRPQQQQRSQQASQQQAPQQQAQQPPPQQQVPQQEEEENHRKEKESGLQ